MLVYLRLSVCHIPTLCQSSSTYDVGYQAVVLKLMEL